MKGSLIVAVLAAATLSEAFVGPVAPRARRGIVVMGGKSSLDSLPRVVLKHGNGHQAVVHLHGGCVSSYSAPHEVRGAVEIRLQSVRLGGVGTNQSINRSIDRSRPFLDHTHTHTRAHEKAPIDRSIDRPITPPHPTSPQNKTPHRSSPSARTPRSTGPSPSRGGCRSAGPSSARARSSSTASRATCPGRWRA